MKVQSRQSIFDIALQNCGSVEAAFNLAMINDLSLSETLTLKELSPVDVINKNISDYYSINEINPATELTETVFTDTAIWEGVSVKTSGVQTIEIPKIRNGQSVFDLAIERCGSIEAAFDISSLNGVGLCDVLTIGQVLSLPNIVDKDTVNSFSLNKNAPATAISGDDYNETISQEGIEFWAIEKDFVVN